LDNNNLKNIPSSISELPSLWELFLEHNVLEEIPDSLGHMKSLNVLSISENKIDFLPASWISLRKNCKKLFYENNLWSAQTRECTYERL
jgi:Leucine-rich repeat (LRR) protein